MDDETYNESSSSSESSLTTWINWFCSLSGHEFYLPVPEDFIEDEFNLTGLDAIVPYYMQALESILDLESDAFLDEENEEKGEEKGEDDDDDGFWKEVVSPRRGKVQDPRVIEPYAFMLYGLIHQRYLLSQNGLRAMARRYSNADFGTCPRYLCEDTPVFPVGRHDEVGKGNLCLYCPRCLDIYHPANSIYQCIDGAHFGSSYSQLLLLTYPEFLPSPNENTIYKPKIFGFKVNSLSESGPRNQWLRTKKKVPLIL